MNHRIEIRDTHDPNRKLLICSCGWTSVSTGPKARTRLEVLARRHVAGRA